MNIVKLSTVTIDDEVFSTVDLQMAHNLSQRGSCIPLQKTYSPAAQSDVGSTCCSLREMAALLRPLAVNGESRIWAAKIGAQAHLTSYGIIGFALMSSATLIEALDLAEEFCLLLNMRFGFRTHRVDDEVVLELTNELGLSEVDKAFWLSMDIGKVLRLLVELNNGVSPVRRIELDFDIGGDEQVRLSEIYGAPITGGACQTAIIMSRSQVEEPLLHSHRETHLHCKSVCASQLSTRVGPYDISIQVQKLLLDAEGEFPTLVELASELHLSARTLRRRLDTVGKSYNLLVNEVRKKIAIRYLLDTPLTTEQIAEQLNYSDAANFRHAFKRWTGCSPRDYRSHYRPSVIGLISDKPADLPRRQIVGREHYRSSTPVFHAPVNFV